MWTTTIFHTQPPGVNTPPQGNHKEKKINNPPPYVNSPPGGLIST